jgi:hypothetical protein
VTDQLTVITEVTGADGSHRLVELQKQRDYNPVEDGSGLSKLLNHFALHLSIGQAF